MNEGENSSSVLLKWDTRNFSHILQTLCSYSLPSAALSGKHIPNTASIWRKHYHGVLTASSENRKNPKSKTKKISMPLITYSDSNGEIFANLSMILSLTCPRPQKVSFKTSFLFGRKLNGLYLLSVSWKASVLLSICWGSSAMNEVTAFLHFGGLEKFPEWRQADESRNHSWVELVLNSKNTSATISLLELSFISCGEVVSRNTYSSGQEPNFSAHNCPSEELKLLDIALWISPELLVQSTSGPKYDVFKVQYSYG